MATGSTESSGVKTTKTSFRIVEALMELDGARISELAADLGRAKSTVHRHLESLCEEEYVTKDGDVYRLGLKFLQFGEHARYREEAYRLAKAKVEELARETGERAQFIVEEHGKAVYVHCARGSNAVDTDSGLGKRIPLHATAAGKSILAHMPEQNIREHVEENELARLTDSTIVDTNALFTELEEIREREYSINDQENTEGLRAVGVAVKRPDGRVIGAISISGPTHRMKGEWFDHDLPNLLLGTANELELNVAYS